MITLDRTKLAGDMGRIDWSREPGLQPVQPKAPEAVRVSYLLRRIAQDFLAVKAAAIGDGKEDVLVAKTCTLEVALSWTVEANGGLKFWVLELGADLKRETGQKLTIEMTLESGVRLVGASVAVDERRRLADEESTRERTEVTGEDGGALPLAFMLEKLADEFREAKLAMAAQEQILRFKCVTLELSGAWTAGGSAKFVVIDLGGGASREHSQTITVEMEPSDLESLVGGGLAFLQ
jgi:hypothetical protein